jgi:acyl phosphate:glycerol-3-phosphate acyltransferase
MHLGSFALTELPVGREWLALALSYLLGAVPFGLLLVRVSKGIDLRKFGSGNIGASNALRAAGKPIGYAVFALDALKGWVPTFVFAGLFASAPPASTALRVLCGGAAVLGHCFPVYLGFRGGKGVATACGVLLALDWIAFLIGGAAWIATLALSHYIGLASMVMACVFAVAVWVRQPSEHALIGASVLLALLIIARHRSNISRMLAGTEPKSGPKSSSGGRDADPSGADRRG